MAPPPPRTAAMAMPALAPVERPLLEGAATGPAAAVGGIDRVVDEERLLVCVAEVVVAVAVDDVDIEDEDEAGEEDLALTTM